MPVLSVSNLLPENAFSRLKSGFECGVEITVIGEREVSRLGVNSQGTRLAHLIDYEGRAASYLLFDERFTILKPDETLLVHSDEEHL